MRKWLAGVLAAAMCFVGGAALAECAHENERRNTEWRNESYESTGDSREHVVKYDLYSYMYCPDCYNIYDEKLLVTGQETKSNHSWNSSNVCYYCGQENVCVHPDAYQNTAFSTSYHESTGDAQTHISYGYEYTEWYCQDCGLTYGRSEEGVWKQITENHWWSDGICPGCNQENSCQHEHTSSYTSSDNYTYEQIGDEREHRVIYDEYQCTRCDDCDTTILRTYIEKGEYLSNHNWDTRGVLCLSCGYENICAHEQTKTNVQVDSYSWHQIGNAKKHQVKRDYYIYERCSDCDYLLSKTYSHSEYSEEDHYWNDKNRCWDCAQINTCSHDGETESHTEDENHRYESTGNPKLHRYTWDVYEVIDCANCGEELSRTFKKEDGWEGTHEWNEKDVCRQCKQVNICVHDGETTTHTQSDNGRYESIGDPGYHRRLYDMYEITSCANCGEELSRTFKGVDSYESQHSWNNDICRYCGQNNTCLHEVTKEETNYSSSSYTKIDENTHLRTITMVIQERCATCYLYLSERVGGEYDIVEKHRWDEDGVCWHCSAESTCEHANTRERKSVIDRVCADLGDGVNHSVSETAQVYTYCDDCERRVSDYHEETSEYTEEHGNMYRCGDCGHEKECLHENGSHQYEDWLDTHYIVLDEKTHACYGKVETRVYCCDCEEELSVTLNEGEKLLYTRSHNWNGRNVCHDCSYVNPNPCAHSNTDITLMVVYRGDWIAQGDAMHTTTIICKEVSYCTDCGETVGEISALKKVIKTEEHDFESGDCWRCGYKNSCTHGGATHTEKHLWNWWGEGICIDDKTHKLDAVYAILTYCDLCGARIAEEELPREWVIAEHEMYGDECDMCDYRIDCEHKNIVEQVMPEQNYLFCESISANAHAATYELYYYDYCEDCDTKLEDRYVFAGVKKVNEPHNMVSGCCVACGYCEHPAEKIEKKRTHVATENVAYNEYMHISVETYSVKEICGQCGGIVEEYIISDYSGIAPTTWHFYDEDGVCEGCGYINLCKHENAYRLPPKYDTVDHEDIGNGMQHWVKKWASTSMYCPDCRYGWDYQRDEEPVVSVEDHNYFWSKYGEIRDKCQECGYVSNNSQLCKHENTEESTTYGEYWVLSEYVDEQYHNEYCKDQYRVTECSDCGLELSRELEQEGLIFRMKERHSISNECRCGYVNPCKHLNTLVGIWGSWESYTLQIDDTHHERVQLYQKGIFCADCGMELSKVNELVEKHSYEQHTFNEYGYCSVCNYVNRCKHTKTQINHDYSVYSCKCIDDAEHEIRHRIEKIEECVSCGEVIQREIIQDVMEVQPHTDADACQICGWSSSEHVCAWEPDDSRKCISATAIDKQTHEAVIQWGNLWRCPICDNYGEGLLYPMEVVVESHNFSDLGRCLDCGYVNFCEHEETYEKSGFKFEPAYQIKDEWEHTCTGIMWKETRCKTCDQRISYTAELNAQYDEEHVFDSVIDLICDLCGYEMEMPEEATTPEPTPTATPEPTPTVTPEATDEPEETGAPAPTKKPGSGGSGSSGGTAPSRPKDTATPTPQEAVPQTGDASLPIGSLILAMVTSLCGIALLKKRKLN